MWPWSGFSYQGCFQLVELLAGQQSGFQHRGELAELVHYGKFVHDVTLSSAGQAAARRTHSNASQNPLKGPHP